MRISPAPLAILCLAAGGAGGWFLRGSQPARPAATATVAKGGSTAGQDHPVADNDSGFATPPPPRLRPDDHAGEDGEAPDDDSGQYAANVQEDLKWKVNSWKTSLGLRPEQIASLEEAIKKTVAAIAPSPDGEDGAPAGGQQEALDQALAGLLDPQQKAKYQEWQDRRQQLQREAQATTQLAEMEDGLLLDPQQRDAVRKALIEQAAAHPVQDDRPPAPMIDPQMITELNEKLGDGMDDPQLFQTAAKAWIDKKISADTEAMKTYLRPDQLESYRHLLERKYSGWMDPTQ
ncbi:MAG: hypothetical protein JWO82_2252 [Akkermansiaceae bacterium]|nr:hypothetical protein [Akkermansiaceae bacterium]